MCRKCVRSLTIACFLSLAGPSCSNSDNLALLLDTLKPVHKSVCDDKPVSLACPTGTSVSILVAQYGDKPPAGQECEGQVEKTCKLPTKMQYMLLQRVVEECQKKPSCTFDTSPGADDPCPSSRKFVEVSYKCRPYEFRSLNACNEQVVKLSCNPHNRIAVYDVQYGRIAHESLTCPQPQGIPDETCSTPYAVETVMRVCHGKRRCQFVANRNTFDTFCKPYTRPYIKVIYACVPLGVLTERYESPLTRDEKGEDNNVSDENLYDDTGEVGEKWREPYPIPPIADPALQLPTEVTTTPGFPGRNVVLYTPSNRGEDKGKNFKVFIYIGIALIVTVIITAIALIIRCHYAKKAKQTAKNGEMFTTEAPNVFSDAASDLDNDVEVSHISGTFYDPVHPDMILYRDADGSRNTIRAMRPLSTVYPCGPRMYGNVDYVPSRDNTKFPRSRSKEEPEPELMTSPKSLGAYSTSQFYYG